MSARTVGIIAAVVIVALIVADVFLALDGRPRNTWSEVIHHWGTKVRLVPFGWGMLLGHFFARGVLPGAEQPAGVVLLAWLAVAVQIVCLGFPVIPPLAVGLAGVVAGGILWQC